MPWELKQALASTVFMVWASTRWATMVVVPMSTTAMKLSAEVSPGSTFITSAMSRRRPTVAVIL